MVKDKWTEKKCLSVYDELRKAHHIINRIDTDAETPEEIRNALESVNEVLYMAEAEVVRYPHK